EDEEHQAVDDGAGRERRRAAEGEIVERVDRRGIPGQGRWTRNLCEMAAQPVLVVLVVDRGEVSGRRVERIDELLAEQPDHAAARHAESDPGLPHLVVELDYRLDERPGVDE